MFSKLFRRKGARRAEPHPPAAGPRRREHERFACRIPLRARCSSWASFRDLFSSNISRQGIFVPSDEPAQLGERVELELITPDGRPLQLVGTVMHLFGGGAGKPRGLGVRLDQPTAAHAELFRQLLDEAARRARVRPSSEALGGTGPYPAQPEPPSSLELELDALFRRMRPPVDAVAEPASETHLLRSHEQVETRPLFGRPDPISPSELGTLPLGSRAPAMSPAETGTLPLFGMPNRAQPVAGPVSTPPPVPTEEEDDDGEYPVHLSADPVMDAPAPAHRKLTVSSEELLPAAPGEEELGFLSPDDVDEDAAIPSEEIPIYLESDAPPGRGPAARPAPAVPPTSPAGGGSAPSVALRQALASAARQGPNLDDIPPPPGVAPSSPTSLRLPARPRAAAAGGAAPLVGIDFGTSMSSLAMVRGGEVHVLRVPGGRYDIPSVVALDGDRLVVGEPARERLVLEPQNAIASPKRLLGRRYDDRELEPFLATLAMPHSRGADGEVLLEPNGYRLRVCEVCAPIFATLRELAEQQMGQPVGAAVLTVPVSFDERRCQALVEAANLAGLEVLATLDEPTAAALTYSDDPSYQDLVAVYDFGGGTFDFSVVDVSSADIQVVATAGDTWLGGDDLDEALAGAAANAFWREHHIELRNQAVQWQRLRMAAERTKRELSVRQQAVVELRRAALTARGPLDLHFPVTRQTFAELASPIIQRSLDTCREALTLCDLEPTQLRAVFLSGGSCYVPAVRHAVARFFGRPPKVVVPPERAVVMGAAMFAAQQLSGSIIERAGEIAPEA